MRPGDAADAHAATAAGPVDGHGTAKAGFGAQYRRRLDDSPRGPARAQAAGRAPARFPSTTSISSGSAWTSGPVRAAGGTATFWTTAMRPSRRRRSGQAHRRRTLPKYPLSTDVTIPTEAASRGTARSGADQPLRRSRRRERRHLNRSAPVVKRTSAAPCPRARAPARARVRLDGARGKAPDGRPRIPLVAWTLVNPVANARVARGDEPGRANHEVTVETEASLAPRLRCRQRCTDGPCS